MPTVSKMTNPGASARIRCPRASNPPGRPGQVPSRIILGSVEQDRFIGESELCRQVHQLRVVVVTGNPEGLGSRGKRVGLAIGPRASKPEDARQGHGQDRLADPRIGGQRVEHTGGQPAGPRPRRVCHDATNIRQRGTSTAAGFGAAAGGGP